MHKMVTRVLTACICLLSSSVFAADSAPEATPPVVIQTVEAAPPGSAAKQVPEAPIARIGYVDTARIAADSERGKALKSLLTTKKEALQKKIDVKRKSLEKLKTTISEKIEAMTPQQRETKSKEFKKKYEELQSFAQSSEEELMSLQSKEMKKLYDAVEQASAAHGKANNFSAIVVQKELLYIGSSVDAQDVTQAIITALNQTDTKK